MRTAILILSAASVILQYFLGSNKLYMAIVALLAIATAALHMARTDRMYEDACEECPILEKA